MSTIDETTDDIADESPGLDPATFDLDAWIGGATATVRAVTLHQRSDLVGEVEALQRELRIAESISDEDRGMNDPSPEGVRQRLEELAREFERSAVTFKIEGRSDEARERIEKRLKKQDVKDQKTITLHQLADAIIEPAGVTPEILRKLGDKSEPQLKMLLVAYAYACGEPPKVDVPFSNGSSGSRKRDR